MFKMNKIYLIFINKEKRSKFLNIYIKIGEQLPKESKIFYILLLLPTFIFLLESLMCYLSFYFPDILFPLAKEIIVPTILLYLTAKRLWGLRFLVDINKISSIDAKNVEDIEDFHFVYSVAKIAVALTFVMIFTITVTRLFGWILYAHSLYQLKSLEAQIIEQDIIIKKLEDLINDKK